MCGCCFDDEAKLGIILPQIPGNLTPNGIFKSTCADWVSFLLPSCCSGYPPVPVAPFKVELGNTNKKLHQNAFSIRIHAESVILSVTNSSFLF